MRKIILLVAGLAAALSAPALANPTCLEFGEIYNWTVTDDKTLIVEDNFHNRFKVGLMSTCPGLSFKERVGFKSMGAMQLSCLRPGDDVLIHNFGTGGQVCPITAIVPQSR